MDIYKVSELLSVCKWRESFYISRHWYVLKKDCGNWFDDVVGFIRSNGVVDVFKGKEYRYLYLNGFKYWVMKDFVNGGFLINKAKVKYLSKYDDIAYKYDDWFSDGEFKKQDLELSKLLPKGKKVLDIGCGTGLYVELTGISPENYVGIDISEKMLSVFRKKFPDHQVVNSSFEDFYSKGFDVIVCLYGGLNYVRSKYFDKLRVMLNDGGKLFLMFFGPEYVPVTYSFSGEFIHFYRHNVKGFKFYDYVVVTDFEGIGL